MEDRLTWTDTVSAFALHDAGVHPTILKMWGHLRASIVFFMRYQHGQHSEEHIQSARDELLAYSRLVTETWNMHELMTLNLHTCLVHVPEQARQCGPTAFAAEWWLERLMQVFKRVTKYRCTRYPETTAVQHWLLVQALDDWKLEDPLVSCLLDDTKPDRTMEGVSYDEDTGRSWLNGVLQDENIRSPARYELMTALEELSKHAGGDGMAVTNDIDADALGEEDDDGRPVVQLSSSKTASIKEGAVLVRTKGSALTRQDYHALVAYSTEDPSPAAALAACSRAAADAASHALVALQNKGLPVGADSVAQLIDLKDAVDKAQAASAACCREAGDADQHAAPVLVACLLARRSWVGGRRRPQAHR
jgi:hypothetical protein